VVSPQEAAALADQLGLKYFESSSKDNLGITESVEGLVKELLESESLV
jgi:hypothetical protein